MSELAPEGGWMNVGAARLQAPPPAQRGLLFRLLERGARRLGRPGVPDVIAVLHLNPRLFWPWLFFASRLMPRGRLPARLRELLILRTAWNCRSRYEWGQHVDIALRVGATDADIVAVTRGPGAFVDPTDRGAVQACDELCSERAIAATTWSQLSGVFSEKLRIELMMLVGHYVMIAGFLNSTGLVLEPPIEARLQDFYRRNPP